MLSKNRFNLLFSTAPCLRDTPDFDVQAAAGEPPLVAATPIVYASLPADAASAAKINYASTKTNVNYDIQPSLTRHPTSIQQCPHCGAANVMTSTKTYPGPETFLMCFILLLVFWPVCWMPLVVDAAKRTDHMCTRCGGVVGYVKPLSDCCVERRG
jgi:ribosomal protein S27AE